MRVTSRLRRIVPVTFALGALFTGCATERSITGTKGETRTVGLAYSTINGPERWQAAWGTPMLGRYSSDDTAVIAQHAAWLADAGVDFIFVDWSNDLQYFPGCHCRPDIQPIEDATYRLMDTYAVLPKHPKVALMIGFPDDRNAIDDGALQRKADQVYGNFIADKARAANYMSYQGKPLLIVYTGTPAPFQVGLPPWNDPRFTVRWLTGFVSNQPALIGPNRISRYGYWSWEDRGPQTYTLHDGQPEAMTITASWRGDPLTHLPAQPRLGGQTFEREWDRARAVGVTLALVVSWNEWARSEAPDAQHSKDLEPSVEFGDFYLRLLKDEIARFKAQ